MKGARQGRAVIAPQGLAARALCWVPGQNTGTLGFKPSHPPTCQSSPSRGLSTVMVPSPISPANPSFLGVAKWGERRPRPPGAMMKPRAKVLSSRKSLEVGRIWFLAHSVILCPPLMPPSYANASSSDWTSRPRDGV